ncbi:hypothetical protein ABIC85_000776 [Oerskovia enterophila]|uniref:Uncharacterized protein n=1 Tax=Oerskovia enterophila TaxID=43678 RepID=A0A163QA50_9CELL|nr:hypothetical protein OJAG_34280 [Oerskovia enterophila]OCI29306.1 hypothetical protein OERS_40080 [Oerskovia enterophila]
MRRPATSRDREARNRRVAIIVIFALSATFVIPALGFLIF